jgi:Tfp pilus tip-associated adhesin PilY1
MQAMKTAASRSFDPIDDKYRIGYFSINNNTTTDFQNISEFSLAQKKNWYDKLFAATPYRIDSSFANTPLRVALSNAGRLFAGKLSSLNGVSVTDPVQYYCQPNVAILSTDGYWNEGAGFKIDGTPVGHQDSPGMEERPMLDGGTGQLQMSTLQKKKQYVPNNASWNQSKVYKWQSHTQQTQIQTLSVEQYMTSQLQKSVAQWQASDAKLQWRHTSWTYSTKTQPQERLRQLQQSTAKLQRKTGTLQMSTKDQLQKSTSQLQAKTLQAKKRTSHLQQRVTQVQKMTTDDGWTNDSGWYNPPDGSCTPVATGNHQVLCQTLTVGTYVDVDSCTTQSGNTEYTNQGGDGATTTYHTKVECAYTNWTASQTLPVGETCTAVPKSTVSTYTVGLAVECDAPTGTWSNVDVCDASGSVECQYLNWTTYADAGTCVAKARSTGTHYEGPAVQCQNDGWTAFSNLTTGQTCTTVDDQVKCQYVWTTVDATDGVCTPVSPSTGPTYTVVQAMECPTTTWSTWATVSTCTPVTTGYAQVKCQYEADYPSVWTNVASCTPKTTADTIPPLTGPMRECQFTWSGYEDTGNEGTDPCVVSGNVECLPKWTAWTDLNAGLPCHANSTGDVAVWGDVQCRYAPYEAWYDISSCTVQEPSAHPTYTVNPARACHQVWGDWANVTSGNCTVDDDTHCQYTVWTGWTNGTHASCPGGVDPTAASPYTVFEGVKCQTDWTEWSNTASCTVDDTTHCRNIDTPWVDDPTYDPAHLDPSKEYREVLVSDWAPAVPSATEANPSPSNAPCVAGLVSGVRTECRQQVPGQSPAFATLECVPQDAAASPLGVKTLCTEVTTGPSTVSTCTPIAATAGNSYKATLCTSSLGSPTPDTLADVARYYWNTDLRDPSLSNCTGGPVLSGGVTMTNEVCTNTETVPQQRMNTYTLGLGASGVMQFQADYKTATSGDFYSVMQGTLAAPATGICSWQAVSSGACNWPKPVSDKQTNIDDLWHAAVNGRGTYFSAEDPSAMAAGISSALMEVTIKDGSLAAPAFTSTQLDVDSKVFTVEFSSGPWTGDVKKYAIDLATRSLIAPPLWSAKALLDNKVSATHTSRNIYVFDSGGSDKRREFLWSALTTQRTYFEAAHIASLTQMCTSGTICLDPDARANAAGENLVNFLRGDRNNEGAANETARYYRQRVNVLGDIVNSEPVYVQKSVKSYADHGYSDFKADIENRVGMVYVGANDGMLHAFRAEDGEEAWAFVPGSVLPEMYRLADKNYSSKHVFLVDGTPVTGDICSSNCDQDSAEWKTILVGGLNRGGRGYYALDITDPASPKGLWEFTSADDANIGYTYGDPVITKLGGSGANAGKWVVLVTSGYNNVSPGDGRGHLFVLNADTGALIHDIPTAAGSTTTPSGLAKIAAFANYPLFNNTALRAYGGDLEGNLWRFDFNDTVGTNLLATLKDAGGVAQPITSRPEQGVVQNRPVVFVGTGQLLGVSDLTTTGTQSLYAIKDEVATGLSHGNPRSSGSGFVQQTMTIGICATTNPYCTPGRTIVTVTKNPVDWVINNGWYVDFPVGGERVNTSIALVDGILEVVTNTPQSGACVPAGTSNLYFLDYKTGGYVLEDSDGLALFGHSDNLSTRPVTTVDPEGNRIIWTQDDNSGADSTKGTEGLSRSASERVRRVSWRELIIENE